MTFLLLILLAFPVMADSQHYGPKYDSDRTNLEFQNVYKDIPTLATTPTVTTGAGAPSKAPKRIGDIYISTTTSKVYIATSTVNGASFAVVN